MTLLKCFIEGLFTTLEYGLGTIFAVILVVFIFETLEKSKIARIIGWILLGIGICLFVGALQCGLIK